MSNENSLPTIQVICSTLNQMVNYITIKKFNAEEVYNVTFGETGNKKKWISENEHWDNNLKSIVGKDKIKDIIINNDNLESINNMTKEIQDKLKDISGPILWNITGGQRHLLLAINKIFCEREGDYLCYIEGNSNRIFVFKSEKDKPSQKVRDEFSADLKEITVDLALRLMGFEEHSNNFDYKVNFSNGDGEVKANKYSKKLTPLNELIPSFERLVNNDDFRKKCLAANKKGSENFDNFKDNNNINDYLLNELKDEKTGAFGKPFEFMVAAKIKEIIIDKKLPVNEMIVSHKISFSDKEMGGANNRQIDELDIVLATSSGKLIIFELKTGSMSSDVAKSTKYSTYAVSGIYGLPILIVPLKENEIKEIVGNEDTTKVLRSTISAAKRATLKVWGIDKLEEYLTDKLKI
ncbi:hypothetical protein ACMCNP_06810 [Candidatus Acidulodesulfobacterium sp. H_13]|uniref:hypothetical protein n=1 Tax=Candidatus Acidulodesulfobacterium sp. H_13 TaxID=3395470 RepID=UPI003AF57C5E